MNASQAEEEEEEEQGGTQQGRVAFSRDTQWKKIYTEIKSPHQVPEAMQTDRRDVTPSPPSQKK